MTNLIVLGFTIGSFILLCLFAWGIASLVGKIQDYRWNKWRAYCLENYPELKVLLGEYHRLRREHRETVKDAVKLQKEIDECIATNKYRPRTHCLDAHIENLKEYYQELLDIQAEQKELVDKARKDLIKFWETNFPDLPEHKRLMWWNG